MIKAKPEGRENIYVPEKESLKDFIEASVFNEFHHYLPNGSMIIGIDYTKEMVLKDIENSERLAVFTDDQNMGHSLAVIINNELGLIDIGKITESDLTLTH